jgi:hypothetical protein
VNIMPETRRSCVSAIDPGPAAFHNGAYRIGWPAICGSESSHGQG